jgi:phosphate uptake regulator
LVNITNRKIQKLGSSSLVVTIPKSWAVRLGLSVGDKVAVIDAGDHLKIVPHDLLSPSGKKVARFMVKKMLENQDVTNSLINCLYVCGAKRVQFMFSSREDRVIESIIKTLEERKGCEVKDLSVSTKGYIEVELKCNNRDPKSALKVLNSEVHEVMTDIAFGILGDNGKKKEAINKVNKVKELIEDLIRGVMNSSENLSINEVSGCGTTFFLLNLRFVGNLIELLARSSKDITDPRAVGYVSALRAALSDVLGGLAAGSYKRVLRAKTLAEKIGAIIESPSEDKKGLLYGVLLSLSTSIRSLAEEALCLLFLSQ